MVEILDSKMSDFSSHWRKEEVFGFEFSEIKQKIYLKRFMLRMTRFSWNATVRKDLSGIPEGEEGDRGRRTPQILEDQLVPS